MTKSLLQFVDVSLQQTFGLWLRTKRTEARMSLQSVANKAGISKQYLSVLERAEPHALTGKPVKPKVELVEQLAKALGADPDEARIAAGFAPESFTYGKPQNLQDLFRILSDIGIDGIHFVNEDALRSASPEELQELLDSIRVAVEVTLSKHRRKPPNAPTEFGIRQE